MDQHDQPPKDDKKATRKRYDPPRVIEEAAFEGYALKCGQVQFCGPDASGAS